MIQLKENYLWKNYFMKEESSYEQKTTIRKILDMLKIDGTITIKEIIDELDISDMTARRDLDALEADGLLTRIHGGAQLLSSKKPLEKTHIEKKSLNTKEKLTLLKKPAL